MGMALVVPGRKAAHEDELFRRLKTDLETWARQILNASLRYGVASTIAPWEHEVKTAAVYLDDLEIGRLSILPAAIKRRIDEHLAAWSIALAEIDLSGLFGRRFTHRKLVPVPVYPQTDVDFSVLADARDRYTEIEKSLGRFDHPLLRRLSFVDSYEGGSVPPGKRSFTFRVTIGDPDRTLTDDDIQRFRAGFIEYLHQSRLVLRT